MGAIDQGLGQGQCILALVVRIAVFGLFKDDIAGVLAPFIADRKVVSGDGLVKYTWPEPSSATV